MCGTMRNTHKILFLKAIKKLLGRPRHKWVDNIVLELEKIGHESTE
jgi:hypothetical protein